VGRGGQIPADPTLLRKLLYSDKVSLLPKVRPRMQKSPRIEWISVLDLLAALKTEAPNCDGSKLICGQTRKDEVRL